MVNQDDLALKLTVTWINATRPHEKKVQIETLYRDTLLDFYRSPEIARHSRDTFNRCRQVGHDWPRANYYARRVAVRDLTPCETVRAAFRVNFE